jgi:histidyl-tRNA synthetase
MALSTQPYKGTRDFYPPDMKVQQFMFGTMRKVIQSYGYQEYDGPMLEPFELYAAKSGEELVNQQLYWLMDRGERKLAVRPEMTPTLARMVAGKVNELAKPVRWYSIPNLWRYERPQRGRLREHWQLNVDVLGGDPLLADAEILHVAFDILKAFKGESKVSLRINSRRLIDDFFRTKLGLSAEVGLQVTKALDARAKIGEDAYGQWLNKIGVSLEQNELMEAFFSANFSYIQDHYPCQGTDELHALFGLLEQSGLRHGEQFSFDPLILRGLDYYTGTVFELYDNSPENRRAMFGGGRYDNLIGLFGNQSLSGVGFGMGDVTLRHFLETHQLLPTLESSIDVLMGLQKLEWRPQAELLATQLRGLGLKVITPLEVSGFGAQLKLALKHEARWAILFGDDEFNHGKVLVKDLLSKEQSEVKLGEVALWFQDRTTNR